VSERASREPVSRRPRPTVVTLAAGLLLLAAPALALYSMPPLIYAERILEVYRTAFAGTRIAGEVNDLSATSYHASSVALLVAAACLAVCALLILFGNRAARVLAWVLGGLAACASGPAVLLEPAPPPRPPGAMPQAEVERLLEAAMPGWIGPASLAGAAVAVVAMVVAMVLLGTPRANDFFRKPAPVVAPPPPLHAG
jgi:hypothetical protein